MANVAKLSKHSLAAPPSKHLTLIRSWVIWLSGNYGMVFLFFLSSSRQFFLFCQNNIWYILIQILVFYTPTKTLLRSVTQRWGVLITLGFKTNISACIKNCFRQEQIILNKASYSQSPACPGWVWAPHAESGCCPPSSFCSITPHRPEKEEKIKEERRRAKGGQ